MGSFFVGSLQQGGGDGRSQGVPGKVKCCCLVINPLHGSSIFAAFISLRPSSSGCQQGLEPNQADCISLLFINRYEEEINKRTAAENDFVLLKKVKSSPLPTMEAALLPAAPLP